MKFVIRCRARLFFLLGFALLAGCAGESGLPSSRISKGIASSGDADATTRALRSRVDTIVVIYAENRAFDSLYGNFPAAHGLSEVIDPDGRPLPAYVPQVNPHGS